jgi:predicted ester cyclase
MVSDNTAAREATSPQLTRDELIELFTRRQEAYENLDAAALAADYADDVVIDSPISGRHGKREAEACLRTVFSAFMDIKMTPDALIVDGSRVAQLLTTEGTNMGGLFGLAPTGKTFRLPVVLMYELRGRQIVRERRIYDFTGLLVQVGVLKAKPA